MENLTIRTSLVLNPSSTSRYRVSAYSTAEVASDVAVLNSAVSNLRSTNAHAAKAVRAGSNFASFTGAICEKTELVAQQNVASQNVVSKRAAQNKAAQLHKAAQPVCPAAQAPLAPIALLDNEVELGVVGLNDETGKPEQVDQRPTLRIKSPPG